MGRLIWPRLIECPCCDGAGEVEVFDGELDINPVYTEQCPECAGTGEISVIRAPGNATTAPLTVGDALSALGAAVDAQRGAARETRNERLAAAIFGWPE